MDFAVPADDRVNLNENEKKDKYLNFARELKNLLNVKVTLIPIVIGTLGTVMKKLEPGLDDWEIRVRVETIQITALLRSARILRRVLYTCCHLNSSERPSSNADLKDYQGVKR